MSTDKAQPRRRAAGATSSGPAAPSRRRAVLYARYSSKKQNDMSVEDQLALCREAALRQDFEVVGEFSDHAMSGRTLLKSRPGVCAMMERIERGGVEVVIVEGIERIGRRSGDIAEVANWFESHGLEFHSATGGKLEWSVVPFLGAFAEYQSRETGSKTIRGQRGATGRGRVAAGMAFGYRSLPVMKGLNREIHPEEAAIVRRIFDDYAEGLSPREIAKRLNAEGVPSPRGGGWNDSTIRGNARKRDGLLRNEAYVGVIVYGRNHFFYDPGTGNRVSRPNDTELACGEAPELRIIDDATWNRVQERLEATHAAHARDHAELNTSHRPKFLLSRLIVCDCCGSGYTIIGKDRYGCFRRKSGGQCANSKTITRQKIEARILSRLRRGLIAPDLMQVFAAEVASLLAAGQKANPAADLARDLARLESRITRLLDQIEDDDAPAGLIARLREREAEHKALTARIAAASPSRKIAPPSPADLTTTYLQAIGRLEEPLGQGDLTLAANAELRKILGEVRVRPDPAAQDGLAIEIRGDLGRLLAGEERQAGTPKGLPEEALLVMGQISVVAGAGCHHYLRGSQVLMVAGACIHQYPRFTSIGQHAKSLPTSQNANGLFCVAA